MKDEDLDRIVEELKAFLAEAEIPQNYTVKVYKDQVTCCGHIPIGVAIEVEGPKEQPVKNMHEMTYGKIKEICGRKQIKTECSAVETLQNIEGVTFIQG